MKVYGSYRPPRINLTDIDTVPIYMVVGKSDELATLKDNIKAKKDLGSNVVRFDVIDAGHLSILAGKDMSYFLNVLEEVGKYSTKG